MVVEGGRGRLAPPASPRSPRPLGVDGAFLVATLLGLASQDGDVRVDLADDETSLTRTGLDEPARDEPFHGVSDGVPRSVVRLPELGLGGQLVAVA